MSSLFVDKTHRKIDVKELKRKGKKVIASTIGAAIIFSELPGFVETVNAEGYVPPSHTATALNTGNISVPSFVTFGGNFGEDVTPEQLATVRSISIDVDKINDPEELRILTYCENLKEINVKNGKNGLGMLKLVFAYAPSIESIYINGSGIYDISEDDLEFIDFAPRLSYICFSDTNVFGGCEEKLNCLDTIEFHYSILCDDDYFINLDFSKLNNVKTIDFSHIYSPYTLAISFTTEDYNNLLANGVDVKLSKYLVADWQDACQKVDEIASRIPINESDTDQERLNKIIAYILEHYEYDDTISQLQRAEQSTSEETHDLYTRGALYGPLVLNRIVCGNYTALTQALVNRLCHKDMAYYLSSPKNIDNNSHAWNLIVIDGQYYYLDVTWLDGDRFETIEENEWHEVNGTRWATTHWYTERIPNGNLPYIQSGDTDSLDWYLADPDPEHIASIDHGGDHILDLDRVSYDFVRAIEAQNAEKHASVDVSPVTDVSLEETLLENIAVIHNGEDMANEKIKVKIGGKIITASVGAVVGVLSTFGIGFVRQKKKKQQREAELAEARYSYSGSRRYHSDDSWIDEDYSRGSSRR